MAPPTNHWYVRLYLNDTQQASDALLNVHQRNLRRNSKLVLIVELILFCTCSLSRRLAHLLLRGARRRIAGSLEQS